MKDKEPSVANYFCIAEERRDWFMTKEKVEKECVQGFNEQLI